MKLAALLLSTALVVCAQKPVATEYGDPPFRLEPGWHALLDGKSVKGWHGKDGKPHEWFTSDGVGYHPAKDPKALSAKAGAGDRIVNGNGKTQDLVTDRKFGDVELYIEWMVPQGSNSGVYLQGLYEVQILDSYGKKDVGTGDAGAIYHLWINEKPVGGSVPKVNASAPAGEWQSFHVWFRAPRFDGGGKKTANAKFVKVYHNGVLVQENVEVEGGTRAHMNIPEAAENPLMLQGDHGPVAFRNIYWRALP